MTNRFLFATFAATANAQAYIEIVRACRLRQIQMSITHDLEVDNESFAIELSLVPYYQASTNDAQGILAVMSGRLTVLTAVGGVVSEMNKVFPCDIPLEAGQRIYLNGVLTGVNLVTAACVLTCTT